MSKSEGKSFWQTLPGIITAFAALITAIGGCIAVVFGIPAISNAVFGATPTPIVSQTTSSPTQTPYPTYTPFPTTVLATQVPPSAVKPTLTPIFPPTENFIGTWKNIDTNTASWTKIEITRDGDSLFAHFWGACSPTDCDAGITSTVYTGNPVLMTIDHGFVVRNFTFSLNGDTLHVITFSHYTDNSGRADKTTEDDFHK